MTSPEMSQNEGAVGRAFGDEVLPPDHAAALHEAVHELIDELCEDVAACHFERAGEIDGELDDTRGMAITLHNLANTAWSEGDPGEAKRLLKKSLELEHPVVDEESDVLALSNLAFLELATQNVAAANAAIREVWSS